MKNKVEFKGYLAGDGITYCVKEGEKYYLKEPIRIVPVKATMSKKEMRHLISALMQQTFKVTIERVK